MFRIRHLFLIKRRFVLQCLVIGTAPMALGIVHSRVHGQESRDQMESIAQYCIAGIKANRQLINSGEYEANGQFTFVRNNNDMELGNQVRLSCIFDGNSRRFERLKNERPLIEIQTEDERLVYAAPKLVDPSEDATENPGVINRELPLTDTKKVSLVGSFDIRDLGVLSLGELERGYTASWFFNFTEDAELLEAYEESEDKFRLSWLLVNDKLQILRTIWVDASKGVAPIRFEARVVPASYDVDDWNDVSVITSAETSWSKVDGVYVPIRCQFSEANGTKTLDLQIQWKTVNTTSAPDEFSIASIDAPDGTLVVDQTLGTPVLESIIGRSEGEAALSSEKDSSRFFLIVLNIAIVLVIVIFLLLKKRHARCVDSASG